MAGGAQVVMGVRARCEEAAVPVPELPRSPVP